MVGSNIFYYFFRANSFSPDDAREKIVQSTSGIVPELLNMLNAGTTDIDRWQIGVKGLLALRLFEK
jgi:hypothetical protein